MMVELKSLDSEVKLIVNCGEVGYRFGFVEIENVKRGDEEGGHEGEVKWIGEVGTEAMTVVPPVGASFTGMMLGLYAFGELEGCLISADFKYAEFC